MALDTLNVGKCSIELYHMEDYVYECMKCHNWKIDI